MRAAAGNLGFIPQLPRPPLTTSSCRPSTSSFPFGNALQGKFRSDCTAGQCLCAIALIAAGADDRAGRSSISNQTACHCQMLKFRSSLTGLQDEQPGDLLVQRDCCSAQLERSRTSTAQEPRRAIDVTSSDSHRKLICSPEKQRKAYSKRIHEYKCISRHLKDERRKGIYRYT